VIAALLFAAALLAAGARSPQARVVPDASARLRASFTAPARVTYEGELETTNFASERAVATVLRIEHQAPARTRRSYLAPSELFGDYVVVRGGARFDFDAKRRRLVITHNPLLDDQIAAGGDYARVMRNYRPIFGGRETIAGRPADAISLVSRFTGERIVRVLLDAQTHLVLEKVIYHGNGAIASQMRFDRLRYVAHLPPQFFAVATPPGYVTVAGRDVAAAEADRAHVVGRVGFAPVEPRSLPQGFALIRTDVATAKGIPTVHLVYSDGLRLLSLFENNRDADAAFEGLHPRTVRFEGHDAQQVEDGSTTLLSWKERGIAFVLVGDLLARELVPIAASVIP